MESVSVAVPIPAFVSGVASEILATSRDAEEDSERSLPLDILEESYVNVFFPPNPYQSNLANNVLTYTYNQFQYLHFTSILIKALWLQGIQQTIEINFVPFFSVMSQFNPSNPRLSRFEDTLQLRRGNLSALEWNNIKDQLTNAILLHETMDVSTPRALLVSSASQDSFSECEEKKSYFTYTVSESELDSILTIKEELVNIGVSNIMLANIRSELPPPSARLSKRSRLQHLSITQESPTRFFYTPVSLTSDSPSPSAYPGRVAFLPVDQENLAEEHDEQRVNNSTHGQPPITESLQGLSASESNANAPSSQNSRVSANSANSQVDTPIPNPTPVKEDHEKNHPCKCIVL